MAYFLNLFSPETYEAFCRSDRTVSGFQPRFQKAANQIKRGDKFICYMTKLSRWVGILEVVEGPYKDSSPIFYPKNDPFILRFHVKPLVWLPVEKCVPIHDEQIWSSLTFTKSLSKSSKNWTGKIRNGLSKMLQADAEFLEKVLLAQIKGRSVFKYDKDIYAKYLSPTQLIE